MHKPFFQTDLFGNKIEIKTESKKQFTCEDCQLYKICITPKMKPHGRGKLNILIIAEAPGEKEDEQGIPLVGKSGQLFKRYLEEAGYNLDRDFWKTNAIICRPPKNRTPNNKELKCCRENLLNTIEQYKPKGIILLGAVAVEAVIGYRLSGRLNNVSFSDLIGECIPDQEMKTWLCPIYHPSYILRNEYRKDLDLLYKQQLQKAIHTIINKDNPQILLCNCKQTQSIYKALEYIREYKKKEIFAFDYETTGIKPHREKHKIYTASISNGQESISFPFFEDEQFRKEWQELLRIDNKKIAHLARFEQQWTKNKCGYYINNLSWDTCLATKCLNNTKKTSLKLWVYIYFGVIGYDHEIDKYITAHVEDGYENSDHAYNKIEEADLEQVLEYNALDSLFTFWLYEIQQKQMSEFQRKGFEFFVEGQQNLLRASENGICIDESTLDRSIRVADRNIKLHKSKLEEFKVFNYKSSVQLADYLYKELKIKCPDETVKGNPKTDKITLGKINHPFVKSLLEYRRWVKAKDPYMSQYKRETLNGKINVFFNLNKVTTFRSSSNSVNFQNNPKKDKEIMKMIRSFIVPRKGNRLIEWDYKAIEVCMAACYTLDPNLIHYIENPDTDMHRDCAAEICMKDKLEITKVERQVAKNQFVFPEFYGSYFEQTAPGVWNDLPVKTILHLKECGIHNLKDFTFHIQEIEDNFWNHRFPVYAGWKEKTLHDYEKTGYIDLHTGFRCYAPMKRNEVINYRMQGSAFHCLLWTFIKVSEYMKNLGSSFLIGQVHDAIDGDVHPADEERIDSWILDFGTKRIREYWNWIIVPLTIEKESSEIDGNWAEMKDRGVLR